MLVCGPIADSENCSGRIFGIASEFTQPERREGHLDTVSCISCIHVCAYVFTIIYIYNIIYIYILHIRFLAGFSPQTPLQAWLKSGNRILPFTWGVPHLGSIPIRVLAAELQPWLSLQPSPRHSWPIRFQWPNAIKRAYHLHNHPTQKGGPPWSSTHAHCQEGSSSSLCLHLEAARSP